MQEPADSTTMAAEATNDVAPVAHHSGFHTPAQIIGWLPETATPEQQDSAVRANYKFQEIDWNAYHNPMSIPGLKADPEVGGDFSKPTYYSKSLVQPDSIFRPEAVVYRQGVAGDPVPYTIAGDSLITSLLLACFFFAAIAIAKSGNFLSRQLKGFFRIPREGTTVVTETSQELRFQFFLVAQTCLLTAIIFFFFSRDFIGESFSIAHYQILALLTGVIAAYFCIKAMLYTLVDWVFFDKKKNEQWMKSFLFISSSEGIVLFPSVLLLAYFNLSINAIVIYTIFVVVLAKLSAFYKTYIIFFKRNNAILQSFLYFCALEIMPLGTLWGVLAMMDNYLKQIF